METNLLITDFTNVKLWKMSIRENIEIYHHLDLDQFLEILKREHGLVEHPSQAGALMMDNVSFYSPRYSEDHVSILGF